MAEMQLTNSLRRRCDEIIALVDSVLDHNVVIGLGDLGARSVAAARRDVATGDVVAQ
jgi:hypothetical protein